MPKNQPTTQISSQVNDTSLNAKSGFTDQHQLKKRSDLHIARKIWHASGVLLMLSCFHRLGPTSSVHALAAVTLIVVPFDYLRHFSPNINSLAVKLLKLIIRDHEAHQISGISYMMLGTLFLLLTFNPLIVSLTLLCLAVGDPVASFFGILYGRHKIFSNKSLEGSIAALTICACAAWIFFNHFHLFAEYRFLISLGVGLIGAVSEAIPLAGLDDNLSLPVICSCLLKIFFLILEFFKIDGVT